MIVITGLMTRSLSERDHVQSPCLPALQVRNLGSLGWVLFATVLLARRSRPFFRLRFSLLLNRKTPGTPGLIMVCPSPTCLDVEMKGRKPGRWVGRGPPFARCSGTHPNRSRAEISSKAREVMAGKTNNDSTQKTNYDTT